MWGQNAISYGLQKEATVSVVGQDWLPKRVPQFGIAKLLKPSHHLGAPLSSEMVGGYHLIHLKTKMFCCQKPQNDDEDDDGDDIMDEICEGVDGLQFTTLEESGT